MLQSASDDRRGNDGTTDATAPAQPIDDDALDAVMRATTVSGDGDQQVTNEEIEALRAVARRLGPAPFTFDPMAVDLVDAIIQVNYGRLGRPPEVWRSTAVKIAAVLCDSPTTRARLENLWNRLLESHAPGADP
jgi:hypothetical protein